MSKAFLLKRTKTVNEIFVLLGCYAAFIFTYRISKQSIGPIAQGQAVLLYAWRYGWKVVSKRR